jgi:hypothetical protein
LRDKNQERYARSMDYDALLEVAVLQDDKNAKAHDRGNREPAHVFKQITKKICNAYPCFIIVNYELSPFWSSDGYTSLRYCQNLI